MCLVPIHCLLLCQQPFLMSHLKLRACNMEHPSLKGSETIEYESRGTSYIYICIHAKTSCYVSFVNVSHWNSYEQLKHLKTKNVIFTSTSKAT